MNLSIRMLQPGGTTAPVRSAGARKTDERAEIAQTDLYAPERGQRARFSPRHLARSAVESLSRLAGIGRTNAEVLRNAESPLPLKESVALAGSGRNGLWVTVELAPHVVKGGLGQVSETVPDALNRFLDKDVRVMVPYLRPLKTAEPPFESTGITTTLRGPDGKMETFELMQQLVPDRPVVYAVASEKYFGDHDHLYFTPDQSSKVGKDGIFKNIMMYNRAASNLLPALDGGTVRNDRASLFSRAVARLLPQTREQAPAGKPVNRFEGDLEFVIGHDWLTSPMLHELDPDYSRNVGKIFYLHNTYNEARPHRYAAQHGLKKTQHPLYSPLPIGLESADVAIGNKFYVERIVDSLAPGADYLPPLDAHQQAGTLYDMHHGLADHYNPRGNATLQKDGYRDLPTTFDLGPTPSQATLDQLKAFKQQNKAAMQRELGLTENPKAVVVSWVARPDPFQKGFVTVMDTMKSFLEDHPETQLVVAGVQLDKCPDYVKSWVDGLQADPKMAGRLSFPGFVNNQKVVRLAAGSNTLMLPSLYEPYGLSHLEAMRLGAVVVVHAVDGLKATVTDPAVAPPLENLQAYGQTGVFMEPVDTMAYWKELNKRFDGEKSGPELQGAERKLRSALDRAVQLDSSEEGMKVRHNAMRYVEEQHSWEQIARRYQAPIDAAVAAAQARRKG